MIDPYLIPEIPALTPVMICALIPVLVPDLRSSVGYALMRAAPTLVSSLLGGHYSTKRQ